MEANVSPAYILFRSDYDKQIPFGDAEWLPPQFHQGPPSHLRATLTLKSFQLEDCPLVTTTDSASSANQLLTTRVASLCTSLQASRT